MSAQPGAGNDDLRANGAVAQGTEVEQVEQAASTGDGVGKDATFGSATVECRRVVDLQHNYYAVLKVTRSTPHTEVRLNWSRLRKIVGAENAAHFPLAMSACSLCDTAFATLKDPVKKALYDQCTSCAPTPDGVARESWTRTASSEEREVPKMVHRLLNCPGGAVVTCCIFIPGLVVSIMVTGLMWLLIMPFRMVWQVVVRCLGLSRAEMEPVKRSAEAWEGRHRGQVSRLDIAVVGVSAGDERGNTLKRADGTWSRIAKRTPGLEFEGGESSDGPG